MKYLNIGSKAVAVIIKKILTPAEANQVTTELESRLDTVQRGTLVPHPDLAAIHGTKTKRAGYLINYSATFREQIVENDLVHTTCKRRFSEGGH